MRVLASFPGRAGDLLWALPAVRAISEHFQVPVDLQIAGEFAGLVPLLAQQPYLGTIHADERWGMDGAPAPPLAAAKAGVANLELVPEDWDRVFHLAYPGWPARPLPFETEATLHTQWVDARDGDPPVVDLDRPWITVSGPACPTEVAVGFTEAWFELKVGLLHSVEGRIQHPMLQLTPRGSRWTTEHTGCSVYACDWVEAAGAIRNADVFFGDCSALHVLAVALGRRCYIVEPMPERLNSIFWPLGTHDRVRLVRGLDGLSTFDARHAAETLLEVLSHGR